MGRGRPWKRFERPFTIPDRGPGGYSPGRYVVSVRTLHMFCFFRAGIAWYFYKSYKFTRVLFLGCFLVPCFCQRKTPSKTEPSFSFLLTPYNSIVYEVKFLKTSFLPFRAEKPLFLTINRKSLCAFWKRANNAESMGF